MRSAFLLAIAALGGCDMEGDKAAVASHGRDARSAVVPASAVGASPTASAMVEPAAAVADDPKLRRKYGPIDMKFHECVKRQDATLVGRGCPATIVVFGPYVNVPGNSEVELSFELRSPTAIDVFSEMGAQVGKRPLAALSTQTLPANEKRRLGYKVNLLQAETAVETRIWVHGTGPVDFDITNLTVTVR